MTGYTRGTRKDGRTLRLLLFIPLRYLDISFVVDMVGKAVGNVMLLGARSVGAS